jgi:hypothetical protein
MAAGRRCAAKAKSKGDRGRDREQQKHGAERPIEPHMLARGQVAGQPLQAFKGGWIGAIRKDGITC